MNILAPDQTCPKGCVGHAEGPVHMSAEQTIRATAYTGEEHEIGVSRELCDLIGVPAVRLTGNPGAPMLPAQALQLGVAVIFEAFEAQAWSRWNVPQCTSECDDLSGPGAPTGKDRGWHHDDCPWGSLLWAADLVRQVTR